jgi:Flp pilus assembly pilin Flp
MRKGLSRRGQSTLEYAVLIVVIIAALVAMQVYLKRGVQGRMRESTDQIGEQFSPGYTTSNRVTTTFAQSKEVTDAYQTSTQILNQFQNRTGAESVMASGNEYWGR